MRTDRQLTRMWPPSGPTAHLESLLNNGIGVKSSNAEHPPNDEQSANSGF